MRIYTFGLFWVVAPSAEAAEKAAARVHMQHTGKTLSLPANELDAESSMKCMLTDQEIIDMWVDEHGNELKTVLTNEGT